MSFDYYDFVKHTHIERYFLHIITNVGSTRIISIVSEYQARDQASSVKRQTKEVDSFCKKNSITKKSEVYTDLHVPLNIIVSISRYFLFLLKD